MRPKSTAENTPLFTRPQHQRTAVNQQPAVTTTVGGQTVEVMKPPTLPDFILRPNVVNSFFRMFGDEQETRALSRAATEVLRFMGATDAQVDELTHGDFPLQPFCQLFCKTESANAPVIVRRDGGKCVFMIAERIDSDSCAALARIGGMIGKAGMPHAAADLLIAALKARSGWLGDQGLLLAAIANVLEGHPETRLSAESADALGNFVRAPEVSEAIRKALPAHVIDVLEKALESSNQGSAAIVLANNLAYVDEEIATGAIASQERVAGLVELLLAVHDEAIQRGEMVFASRAENTLHLLLGATPAALHEALDTCEIHKATGVANKARHAVEGQLPRIGHVDGKLAVLDPEKPCDPVLLFKYMATSVKIHGAMHFGMLFPYIQHGIRQAGTPNPFTAEGTRELLVAYAEANGFDGPAQAAALVDAWTDTLVARPPDPGRQPEAPQAPSGAEVAGILMVLKGLAPDVAAKLASKIEDALVQVSGAVAGQRYAGDASILSLRVQHAALTGTLDQSLVASVLEHPAAGDLSIAAQGDVFEVILKLEPNARSRLGKEFGQKLSLWNEENVNVLGCTFDALVLAAAGASFDAVMAALVRPHTGAMPDGKLAPALGACLIGNLLKRDLTAEELRTVAMNLDAIVVRRPGELAYAGIMEAFCVVAQTAEGCAALRRLLKALEPHIYNFHNMVVLPVEKRQHSYMTAAACQAALFSHVHIRDAKPPSNTPVAVYFGLCLYKHDLGRPKISDFDRDSEKYLIYGICTFPQANHEALGSSTVGHLKRMSIAREHMNDPGEAGRNARMYSSNPPHFYGRPSLYQDPDIWVDKELLDCYEAARLKWNSGQLNRRYALLNFGDPWLTPVGTAGSELLQGLRSLYPPL